MNDYTSVPKEVVSAVKSELKRLSCKLVFISRYSLQPGDSYLYVVLAQRGSDPYSYVVWMYNTSSGLAWGKYDLSFKSALEIFNKGVC